MRSMFRVLTVSGLAAVAAVSLNAQPRRPPGPPAQLPLEARERQLEIRERMLQRREAMLERREGRGPAGGAVRPGAGPRGGEFRGAGPRGGRPMGMRGPGGGRPGAGLREGGPGRGLERRMMIRRGMMRERIANLKPEQREALRKHNELAGAERAKVREEVQAGKLSREQARARMQKWREDHKPPVDLRRPRPDSGK
jgi:hypothetical protein